MHHKLSSLLLLSLPLATPAATVLQVCYDFGCRTRQQVSLTDAQWQQATRPINSSTTPEEERQRIAESIGRIEQLVAQQVPTGNDRGGNNYRDSGERGQMDCIDESRNTSGYLRAIEAAGLLRFHRILDPIKRRRMLFVIHWTAQIEQRDNGQRWAVDSWFRDNGQPAVIQPLEDWLAGQPLDEH